MEIQQKAHPLGLLAIGLRVVDWLLFLLLFAGILLVLRIPLGSAADDFILFAVFLAGVSAHYTAAYHHLRKARGGWDELAALTFLERMPPGKAPRNPIRRGLRLDRLKGHKDGRSVLVESEPLPYWRGGLSFYFRFIGRGLFETHISTPVDRDDGLDLRLEKRKAGEKTYTRLQESGKVRTRFETEHHLFTDDDELAKRLLDEPLQKMIERLGEYEQLRVQGGQVRLTLPGIASRDQVEYGLEMIARIAQRVEAPQERAAQ